MDSQLYSDRAQELLKLLVERYIAEGKPVGSKTLASDSKLSLSSATIRNVMAELEDKGLVVSPHTSAGRVPTQLGYRMFVDRLITVAPMDTQHIERVKEELDPQKSPQELLESASKLLSEVTQMAGVVIVPKRDQAILRQIEFLPLSGNRVLTILVVNEQEVQNRIAHSDINFSPEQLTEAANYINQHYAGQPLEVVREAILKGMRQDKSQMDSITQTMLDLADKTIINEQDDDCIVAGETNLLQMADQSGLEKLQGLFDAFSQKSDILHLMDGCIKADGVQIFIGEESGYKIFDECSVVSSIYSGGIQQDDSLGVLAVVGPTRMPYQKVIPIVDLTAKILTSALNQAD